MDRERTPIILGLDPGFASVGYALMQWQQGKLAVLDVGVIHTKKDNKKNSVLACEDNLERAREISVALRKFFFKHRIAAVCAEAMSFPRQASVAAKMAMCWGVIADISVTEQVAIQQPTPQRVKKALCGSIKATKEDVEKAVCARVGGDLEARIKALNKGDREHASDAVAVIVACSEGEVLRLLRSLG
jgi:crossover junction endodeoxyribonuclease RuvC